jgi:hypothetical protein
VGFLPLAVGSTASIEEEAREDPPPLGLLPEMTLLAGGPVMERPGWRDLGVESPALQRGPVFHNCTIPRSQKGQEEGEGGDGAEWPSRGPERPLQEVLELLRSLGPAQPQLRELENQVLGFRDRLKVRTPSARWPSLHGMAAGSGPGGSTQASPQCHPGGQSPSVPQFPHLSKGDKNSLPWAGRRVIRGGRGSLWMTCSTSGQNLAPSRVF